MAPRIAHLGTRADFVLSRFKTNIPFQSASNDNQANDISDGMLHAALRHFAEHGLGAARNARDHAEKAFFAGDRVAYDWWLTICRTLDRRLAAQLDYEFDHKIAPAK